MRSLRTALGTMVSAGLILLLVSITPAATPRDTLIIGTTDKIVELTPENTYSFWDWHVFQQLGEALVTLPPNSTVVSPKLAQSWTVSADGKVYTFKLRRGVTFTDGAPFNAAAVKWSLERQLRLDGPEGGVGLIKNIAKVDAIDPATVRITLKEADATFLARMTDPIAPAIIWSPKSTPANAFAKGKFAGTGPYRLVQHVPDQRTVYEAYRGYWGPRPKTRRVITVFFADEASLAAAVESGQVDVGFRSFNAETLKRLQRNPRLSVMPGPSLSVRYIVFNVPTKPFDNQKVRQAIAYAVDRERISRDVFGGLSPALYSMVPPGMWSHVAAFPKRDLNRARSLLQEAGYSTASKLVIDLWLTPVRYGAAEPDVGAVLKSAIEETGIAQVTIKTQEWATYTKAKAAGEYGMFLLGWFQDFVDPDNFLAPWLTEAPEPLGTYINKATSAVDQQTYQQFQKLLTDAKKTTNRSTRIRMYQDAQRLLAESAVLIPLWENNVQAYAVAQKNVKGIVLDTSMNFRTWLISKE